MVRRVGMKGGEEWEGKVEEKKTVMIKERKNEEKSKNK
jgi:hypothetical protein